MREGEKCREHLPVVEQMLNPCALKMLFIAKLAFNYYAKLLIALTVYGLQILLQRLFIGTQKGYLCLH